MPNDILDVVQRFIRATGRTDLVQDYHNGNFNDNGVFAFINDGIKDLDRRIALEVSRVNGYEGEVVTNTSCAIIPNYKQLSTVYFKSLTGSTYTELKPLTLNEAIRKYHGPLDTVEFGDPLYYVSYTDELPATVLDYADTLNTFTWTGALGSVKGSLVTLWEEFCSCIINFEAIDTDNNGLISEEDLTIYGISTGFGMGVLFSSLDLDSDGLITRNDLILYLRNNTPIFTLEHGWLEYEEITAPTLEYGAYLLEPDKEYVHSISDKTYTIGIYAGIEPVYGADGQFKVIVEFDNPNDSGTSIYLSSLEAAEAFGVRQSGEYETIRGLYAAHIPANTISTFSFLLMDKKAPFIIISNTGSSSVYLNSIKVVPVADSISAETGAIHLLPQVTGGYVIATGFIATENVTTLTDTNYWTHSSRIAVLSLAAQYHHELTQAQTSRAAQLDATIDKLIRDIINSDIYNNGPIEDSIVIKG